MTTRFPGRRETNGPPLQERLHYAETAAGTAARTTPPAFGIPYAGPSQRLLGGG